MTSVFGVLASFTRVPVLLSRSIATTSAAYIRVSASVDIAQSLVKHRNARMLSERKPFTADFFLRQVSRPCEFDSDIIWLIWGIVQVHWSGCLSLHMAQMSVCLWKWKYMRRISFDWIDNELFLYFCTVVNCQFWCLRSDVKVLNHHDYYFVLYSQYSSEHISCLMERVLFNNWFVEPL